MTSRLFWDFMLDPWTAPWGDLLSRCRPSLFAESPRARTEIAIVLVKSARFSIRVPAS